MTETISKDPPLLAWHFVGDKLRDGRPVPPDGQWLLHDGPVVPCRSGLHASERLIDALKYAPGATLCRVECAGTVERHDDKIACSRRRIVWRMDASDVLRQFARQCALDVAHLWDMPYVVVAYLSTGDEALRAAAWDAADSAASAAAQVAGELAANTTTAVAADSAASAAAFAAADADTFVAADASASAAASAAANISAYGAANSREDAAAYDAACAAATASATASASSTAGGTGTWYGAYDAADAAHNERLVALIEDARAT